MGRLSDARARLMDAVLELIWTGSYGNTTIDLICEKAGVKKGSFYYFFESKADLAAAALDADWQKKRPELDAIFSPSRPPLDRLRDLCTAAYRKQREQKQRCGCVLGCPLHTLGSEVCTQEQSLRAKIQEILGYHRRYLETAIRDAAASHLIDAADVGGKARMIQAYYEGLMTQARIQNDAEVLKELVRGVFALLGLKPAEPVAA